MSWYNFPQLAIQGGGGFGPDDEERKRRRRAYRDAGAPYQSAGISSGPGGRYEASGPFEGQQAAYEAAGQPPALPAPDLSRWQAAPRQSAAVDLGSGAVPSPAPPEDEKQPEDPLAGYEDFRPPTVMQAERSSKGLVPASRAPTPTPARVLQVEKPPAEELEEKQQQPGVDPTPPARPAVVPDAAPYAGVPERPRYHPVSGTAAGAAGRARQHASLVRGSRKPGSRPGWDPNVGFGPGSKKKKAGVPFDPMRPFRDLPKSVLGRGMKEWKSRAPTQGERQKFPAGVQPSQAEEYLRHRQATEGGALHKFPRGVQPSQAEEFARQRKRKVSFGGVTGIRPVPTGKKARFTPGGISGYVPTEEQKMRGARQYGRMQGQAIAKKERERARGALGRMRSENKQFIDALRKRGGEELTARDQRIAQMQQAGETLEARVKRGGKQVGGLQQALHLQKQARGRQGIRAQRAEERVGQLMKGMGREGLRAQRAEERVGQLTQEGRGLEAEHKARMKRGGEQIASRDKAFGDLKAEANRRIQSLEKRINDGSADREAAQREIDDLTRQLAAAAKKPEAKAPEQRQDLSELKKELAGLRAAIKARPAAGPAGAPPIVVQGGHGGGGASAGGSSSSGGAAAGGGPGGARPDLSKIVEAVGKAVKGKKAAEPTKARPSGATKGITQARRTYTDKRKAKIAELRALKSRRIREFMQKTKKLPKADREKQRREYKARVEAQFKEAQKRFPTARGLKSVGVLRDLIRKIDAFKAAK